MGFERVGRTGAATLSAIALLVGAPRALAGSGYVAATWGDDAVHLLADDLSDLSSFPAGSTQPNGIATDGVTIWTGHFTSTEVIAHDLAGNILYSWPAPATGLQGLEYISASELAVQTTQSIDFHDPVSGAFVRSIPVIAGSVEGIAWDGTYLWQLESSAIHATDVLTGATAFTIANAAAGCSFGGTGITSSGPDELTLGCDGGNWFKVAKADGSVSSSGSNGLAMFGLKSLDGVGSISAQCFGDGSGAACPCGNPGGPDEGCRNSSGAGAVLGWTGSASVGTDNLVLAGSGLLPLQPVLFFQGDSLLGGGAGIPFGDGLRCVGVNVIRLQTLTPNGAGQAATTIPIAATAGVTPGSTLFYQGWYRDPIGGPCGSGFNLTNALQVDWQP